MGVTFVIGQRHEMNDRRGLHQAIGDTFALGTTTLLCSVTDSHSASASGSFAILVTNNGPAFTPPAGITRPATKRRRYVSSRSWRSRQRHRGWLDRRGLHAGIGSDVRDRPDDSAVLGD